MSEVNSSPDNTPRRLAKVIVRTIHLIGAAGLFGHVMVGSPESIYTTLVITSGVLLVLLELSSGWLWLVQLRGVSLYLKLGLLIPAHSYPDIAIACLIAIIAISGFISHAPRWIRYYSLMHGKVIPTQEDLTG